MATTLQRNPQRPPKMAQRAQKLLWLEGRPLNLSQRTYLWPIYNSQDSSDGTNADYTILMTGRQVEKTTTISVLQTLFLYEKAYRSTLYAAPRPDHIRVYSVHRFKQMLLESPYLRSLMRGKVVRDQVYERILSNFSKAYFRVAFLSAEKIRGLTIDLLCIDELQSMLRDHMAIIEQTQAHRPFGNRIYAGTPLSFDNPLSKIWELSTQKEWIVKCTAGHFNKLSMENIGPTGTICNRIKCRKDVDVVNGKWVAMVKESPYDGYRINQLMVPWYQQTNPKTGKRAWDNILLAQRTYSEAQFRNEVLGEPWRAGASVITEDEFFSCCSTFKMTHKRSSTIRGKVPIYMGVDWGGYGTSRTAVCIGCHTDGKFTVLDSYILDGARPEDALDKIVKLCHEWKVSFIMADEGNGHLNNRVLRKKVAPAIVAGCHLSAASGMILKYMGGQARYVANRTETLNQMFTSIRQQTMRFPRKEDMDEFCHDVTSIYEEYNQKSRRATYDHKEGETDDWAHALNLAHTAWMAAAHRIPIRVTQN